MPTASRNIFPENMKSVFKNRKKTFYFREGSLVIRLLKTEIYESRASFRVESRATRSVGFKPETSPSHVPFSTTPPITHLLFEIEFSSPHTIINQA